ncbi:DUF3667 domain-containing protein [Winogradskyella maritima]|uniref:DUF3667 domain-containing protein n=1 Tax=Winogradskyella maritima TaxID=1517766 RepID=A0ABV8AK40_9FLAO|nr:DUF3667 domain-containing protein [Winogradskyella maritima]
MSDTKPKCANCEKPFEEGFEFCPHCGQKTNEELTIGVLFYNTISNYFSFDARFLKSFVPLMFKPGSLAKRFLEGKRLMYLHPAQMYLFVSVIFFFILSFSTREWVAEANKINSEVISAKAIDSSAIRQQVLDSIVMASEERFKGVNLKIKGLPEVSNEIDSVVADTKKSQKNMNVIGYTFNETEVDSMLAIGASDEEIYKVMGLKKDDGFFKRRIFATSLSIMKGSGAGTFIQKMFDTIPISMFFLMPLFALLLKVFYFNKGRYAHHLVFSFYFFSFLFTVFSILFGISYLKFGIPDWIYWLAVLSTFIYFLIAVHRFYGQHWLLSFIKSSTITFIFMLMILPMAFVVIALLSLVI